ncbi:MAG: RNA polymerase sigma-54 factor [Nitrospirae bacterium]|nr:MAG: RNA polymerase sigma-54 factor [Nitrospirota bacterium]
MALETRLDVKLAQKLVLTPQLQQAIKLLQLPQLELSQAINQELAENPFLEEEREEELPATAEEESEKELNDGVIDESLLPLEKLMTFGVDDYFEERGSDGRDLGYFTPGTDTQPSFEQFTSSSTTLYDHLSWQLRLSHLTDREKEIGEVLIGNINDNGYLTISLEEISETTGATPKEVEKVLETIQNFDPPGIGARNLKECLTIQIKALGLEGTLVERIVNDNLRELERKNYQAIARAHNATLEDVMLAVEIIEQLDPKPARNFSSQETNYIIPDVYVEKTSDGYRITLNDEGIPRLRLNNFYRRLLSKKEELTQDEKAFLKEKLRSALWLMKSLDQRNKTIYRVTESIIRFQRDFFDYGPSRIKPLNLRDVAQDIDVHESTVSRVTLNKYLACSHGIFSFRFFFSSALRSENGDVSSTIVKDLIKKIISEEDPRRPYSDQKISDILKKKNIKIARRTVAKYREELKIPAHSRRKRLDI